MRIADHQQVIAGIDLGGSKIDVSLFYGEKLFRLRHIEEKGARGRVLSDVCEQFMGTEGIFDCDYFFIEEPIVGRGVRASMQLSQMLGALLCTLGNDELADRVQLVPVTTWKKHTTGNAHAKKEDVSSWLKAQYPDYHERCAGSQDQCDATCIGIYGARVAAQSRSLVLTGSAEEPDAADSG